MFRLPFFFLLIFTSLAPAQGIFVPSKPKAQISDSALVALAKADLCKFGYDDQIDIRYLMANNLPLDQREDAYLTICGHVQHLSNQTDIERPRLVYGTAGALIRIQLSHYGWKRELWEQLAAVSPHTHVDLDVTEDVYEERIEIRRWPGGIWPKDGKAYPANSFTYEHRVKVRKVASDTVRQRALAPWLAYGPKGKENLAELVRLTQSKVPIVRADWFFNQTAIQFGRKPGYYDFLGVKDEKGFLELGGFDETLAQKFGKELREAVGKSEVTLEPRALARFNTLGGAWWKSLDFALAVGKANPLRVQGKDLDKEYAASEQFIHLPNGFWATGVFAGPKAVDAAGKAIKSGTRADFAPPEIASDRESHSNDKRVHVNLSCIRCHGAGGLRSIAGWWRNLVQPPIGLQLADPKKARELKQQYGRQIKEYQDRDKAVFAAAVMEATGWESGVYAAKYGRFWERYEDADIDVAWVAADLGVTKEELRGILFAKLKASEKVPLDRRIDVVVANFTGKIPQNIGIRQYEEAFVFLKEYLAAREQSHETTRLDSVGPEPAFVTKLRR